MRYDGTRTIDDLGRIVIPKQLVTNKGWSEGTELDIYYPDSKTVALRPGATDHPVEDTCKIIDLNRITLPDEILATQGWSAKTKLDVFDVDDNTIALRLAMNDHTAEDDDE